MHPPPPSIRSLARRLLAESHKSEPGATAAVLVTEKLRAVLTRFAGAEGFSSLLRRALTLARAEAPALESVTIGQDGRLQGLETGSPAEKAGAEAAEAIVSHLLALLVTFVGEPLTLQLVREGWPGATLEVERTRIEVDRERQ
jgi:hypothetical protein